MNLDELERLHAEIVDNEARGNFVAANWLGNDLKEHLAQNFPALLALAMDGERYRWLRDNTDAVDAWDRRQDGWGGGCGPDYLDGRIDAMKEIAQDAE